jgi:hypothetical protein
MSEQGETQKGFVIHRGVRMIEGWPEKIREAQTITHYNIGGRLRAPSLQQRVR